MAQAPCASEVIFFCVYSLLPSPELLLPILRGELDPPLTSVILGWGREVGSTLQMPVGLGGGTLLRHPGGRETWFPTVKGGVRLRSPQESVRTEGCLLCFLLCDRLHRSDNWSCSRTQFFSWTRTRAQESSRTPDTEAVTLGPQSWLCGDMFLLPNPTTGVCYMRQEKTNSRKFFSDFTCSDFTCVSVHKK